MSLFVNPAQFGPGEDFARYPRDEEADLAVAAAEGADVVFAPGAEIVYPAGLRGDASTPGRWEASSRAARARATSAASRPSSRASSASCARSARSSARRTTSSS